MPSSAAGTKVASSMPPFDPEETALSQLISLNTKATCAQPLARAPRIGKGLRRVLCPTLLRGGAWPLPVLAKGCRGIRFLQIHNVAQSPISKCGFARSSKQKRRQVGVSKPKL